MQEVEDADWPDDGDYELIRPEDFLARNRTPVDAQRMGIDRWSDDIGMLQIAASLDSSKRWHKVAAWLMLLAVTLPLLLNLFFEFTRS